jgi:uncharacterized membrane protein
MKLQVPTFRRAFLTGLIVLAPLWVTGWVFYWLFRTIDDQVRPLLSRIPTLGELLPEEGIIGLGVLVAVTVVVLVGLFANNLLGRTLFGSLDRLINRIPWIKGVYGATKEISGVVFSERGKAFRKVVLFEYPRRGVYSIGFVTFEPTEVAPTVAPAPRGRSATLARPTTKDVSAPAVGAPPAAPLTNDYFHVFLPTSPNPTSGYFLLVPGDDAVLLDLSVEEGIKLIVSGGTVVSPRGSVSIDAAITRLREV